MFAYQGVQIRNLMREPVWVLAKGFCENQQVLLKIGLIIFGENLCCLHAYKMLRNARLRGEHGYRRSHIHLIIRDVVKKVIENKKIWKKQCKHGRGPPQSSAVQWRTHGKFHLIFPTAHAQLITWRVLPNQIDRFGILGYIVYSRDGVPKSILIG